MSIEAFSKSSVAISLLFIRPAMLKGESVSTEMVTKHLPWT
jgi:hypothetical protein